MAMNCSLPLRPVWLLTFILLCFLIPKAKTQIGEDPCSLLNIDLNKCLNQSNDSIHIEDSCCKGLNQIVQAGLNCLCSFLRSSSSLDLFSLTPLPLPFSNCFISLPPLSLCQALGPVTVLLPPDSPKEEQINQSSPPNVVVVPVSPPPPQEVVVPSSNLTMDRNSSSVSNAKVDEEDEDGDDGPKLSNGGTFENSIAYLRSVRFFSPAVVTATVVNHGHRRSSASSLLLRLDASLCQCRRRRRGATSIAAGNAELHGRARSVFSVLAFCFLSAEQPRRRRLRQLLRCLLLRRRLRRGRLLLLSSPGASDPWLSSEYYETPLAAFGLPSTESRILYDSISEFFLLRFRFFPTRSFF
ncbi:Large tegument protein like [Senna tora]|uniref:Large tegument protein like n=1 Tax=Senna tora TaxID=362788 RepID=A0A834SLV6_9FABA|nr:Large tegument protein like [Senna tora]